MPKFEDAEAEALAGIAGELEPHYQPEGEDPWQESPFDWIRSRPSRQRGAIGEKLVASWCVGKGFDVAPSRTSDFDRLIHGHRVEIKTSTLWKSGGFKFQQIRDQNYDQLFCLGLSPFDVHAWLVPKSALFAHVIGHTGQHTGAGGSETAWLSFRAEAPLAWLDEYGGTLSEVAGLLTRLGRGAH